MPIGWTKTWKAAALPALLLSSSAFAQTKGAWVDPPTEMPAVRQLDSGPVSPSDAAPSQSQAASAQPQPSERARSIEPQSANSEVVAPRDDVSVTHAARPKNRSSSSPALPKLQTAPKSHVAQPVRTTIPARPASRVLGQQTSQADQSSPREQDARDFAEDYLSAWSGSNDRALQASPAFYGSSVTFHGRSMDARALLTEKRRFAQRWPDRDYRYQAGTMAITCKPDGRTCIVRSRFDFEAANSKLGQRSRGIGAHELVVDFAGKRPVIVSENSRVLRRANGE